MLYYISTRGNERRSKGGTQNMDDFDRIFLTGDKHGDFCDLISDSLRYGFTERDLIIILGDVGVNYYGKALADQRTGSQRNGFHKSPRPCSVFTGIMKCAQQAGKSGINTAGSNG